MAGDDRKVHPLPNRERDESRATEHMTDGEIAGQLRGTISFALIRLGVAFSEVAEAIRDALRDWGTIVREK